MSKPHPFDVMRISCIVLHLALIVFLLYLVALPFPASQRLGDGLVFFRKFAIPDADSLDIQHPLRSIAAELLVSYQKTVFGGLVNVSSTSSIYLGYSLICFIDLLCLAVVDNTETLPEASIASREYFDHQTRYRQCMVRVRICFHDDPWLETR